MSHHSKTQSGTQHHIRARHPVPPVWHRSCHGWSSQTLPPLGVRLTIDEEHVGARGTRFWARVPWIDPITRRRVGMKRSHATREDAELWVDRMQRAARTGVDSGQSLADYSTASATAGLAASTRPRRTTRTPQG
jgi:hypothetical protein